MSCDGPKSQFCHNEQCPLRGQIGAGNIYIHSQKEKRYRCKQCGATFSESKGTPLYRLHHATWLFCVVVGLIAYGCPIQAIVAVFGLDERVVHRWIEAAGGHAKQVHEHKVEQGKLDLRHVQADEICVKLVGRIKAWMGMAMAAPTRLWLGGVVGVSRDLSLIKALLEKVRRCTNPTAIYLSLLICVDGLSLYLTGVPLVFRHPVWTGKVGRPRLERDEGVLMGQVIKRCQGRHLVEVERRVVRGEPAEIEGVLTETKTGSVINTSYIERYNGTMRSRFAALVRRGRAIAHSLTLLEAGMYLVGSIYNFCCEHESLRLPIPPELMPPGGEPHGRKWMRQTPAMAAGLTDHCWSIQEFMTYKIPPPPWVPPKRRGRPPKVPKNSMPGNSSSVHG